MQDKSDVPTGTVRPRENAEQNGRAGVTSSHRPLPRQEANALPPRCLGAAALDKVETPAPNFIGPAGLPKDAGKGRRSWFGQLPLQ